jgi:hypothetical protein
VTAQPWNIVGAIVEVNTASGWERGTVIKASDKPSRYGPLVEYDNGQKWWTGQRSIRIASAERMNITQVKTADDLLTVIANVPIDRRHLTLNTVTTALLAGAADLCGVDTEGMSRKQLIRAIIENF